MQRLPNLYNTILAKQRIRWMSPTMQCKHSSRLNQLLAVMQHNHNSDSVFFVMQSKRNRFYPVPPVCNTNIPSKIRSVMPCKLGGCVSLVSLVSQCKISSRIKNMMTSSNGKIFSVTGQWRGALMFSLFCARIDSSVNNGEAGDLRRHRAHYEVSVMKNIVFLLMQCKVKQQDESGRWFP